MNTNKETLIAQLRSGPVTLKFTKADGSVREMNCTLNEGVLPARSDTARTKAENPDVQSVWDIDASDWRAFRWDSLINEAE
jgi:hypothetical protein